jgi:cytochrome d ubiquinol oxidase subunit I
VHGLIRTADIVSPKVPGSSVALTLTLYVVLYVALLIAYVTVLKYMAEKPEAVLATEAEERRGQPAGVATSPVVGTTST